MSRYIHRASALQITKGQCQQCKRRDVVAVLIAEMGGSAGPDRNRAFYTCEPADVLLRYEVHRCGQRMPEAA